MSDESHLTDRQRRVITHLLASPSTEEACRSARLNKSTLYDWLKNQAFRRELKRQQDEVIERALNCLKVNITKAAETLIKHMDSKRENISIRAAERIIDFTQKSLEHDELERRIEILESRHTQQGGHYR